VRNKWGWETKCRANNKFQAIATPNMMS
jgi:hypothetical protein